MSSSPLHVFSVAAVFAAACGSDGSEVPFGPVDAEVADRPIDAATLPGNPGFVTPSQVAKANVYRDGSWQELGDADWTCLGLPSADQPSSGSINLSGRILDLQSGAGVGNAEIIAWGASPDDLAGVSVSSNAGAYTMPLGMLPPGTRRYGFTIDAPGQAPTRIIGVYYPPGTSQVDDDHQILSEGTVVALPAFVGIARDATQGMVLATLADCQGRRVSNAVAGVSFQAGTFNNAGGSTFYFSASDSGASLPVRHSVSPQLNRDGQFVILNVPPNPNGFVQVWGFRSTSELASGAMTLLFEVRVSIEPVLVVQATLEPRRS